MTELWNKFCSINHVMAMYCGGGGCVLDYTVVVTRDNRADSGVVRQPLTARPGYTGLRAWAMVTT